MSLNKSLEEYIKEYKDDPEFIAERIIVNIVEDIYRLMENKNISNADLAQKMGTSRPYISKLLNGNPNMTILTLVKVAKALGVDVVAPKFIVENRIFSRTTSEPIKLNVLSPKNLKRDVSYSETYKINSSNDRFEEEDVKYSINNAA